ncbi:DUF1289 domain-containing protein [Rhodobacterales bacterium]|nr:DUF1289 domain-containing protein [Rhodobacterales bacterium]
MVSPCINICQIDRKSGLCTGCLRSLDEIAGWATFTDHERLEIMAVLDQRRKELTMSGERQ